MKLNKRPVDQTVADEGVWVEIYDASGENYGTYRIRYAVGDLKYRAAVQQIRKRLSKSEMFRLSWTPRGNRRQEGQAVPHHRAMPQRYRRDAVRY